MKRKVVLFYPPYDGPPLGAPVCLLSLAAPLLRSGFEVVIIDAAIEPDWLNVVLRELRDALCLGISVLTGPMIRGAVRMAKAVKKEAPGFPLFLAGGIQVFCQGRRCRRVLSTRLCAGKEN